MGKLKGKGRLILTTLRLVLIADRSTDFRAFDIPFANLYGEKFQQPVFGSNYWEGKVKPLFNSLPGDASFKIWFTEGGCQCFNRVFRNNIHFVRTSKAKDVSAALAAEYNSPQFQQNFALFDPSDPCKIYVT